MPSFNAQRYLAARAANATVEQACEQSGIGADEAELWEADIASGEVELPRAHVHVHEGGQSTTEESMLTDEEAKVTMKVGDGPEVPIDLKKDLDAPENAEAKEQLGGMFNRPGSTTGENLKLYIERAERLDAEIKDLNGDKSELFKEMKSNGFDTATIKRIIKLRKMETHHRQEAEALLDTYMNAIGMTPIEHAIAMAA